MLAHDDLLPLFLRIPVEVVYVRHQHVDLLVNYLLQIVHNIFIVLVDVNANHLIMITHVIVVFGMVKTNVKLLNYVEQEVPISVDVTLFISLAMR